MCELLTKEADIEVVGEASNGQLAVKLTQELKPDVVIMDIAMPDLNGIDTTYQILSLDPHVKIIALSMYSDRRFVNGMLKAGALGYLLKDCDPEDLIKAIYSVLTNKRYLSPEISDIVIQSHIQLVKKTDLSAHEVLTNREREILQLLTEGKSTSEIALGLSLSIKTIETHRQRIMTKLNIYSVAGLTKYAVKEGLTTLDT